MTLTISRMPTADGRGIGKQSGTTELTKKRRHKITLVLTPLAKARLRALAAQREQTLETVIESLLQREMLVVASGAEWAVSSSRASMLALFDEWDEEDQTEDSEELSRRNSAWEETKANLAAERLTLRDTKRLLPGEEAA